jgi:hypothetical protein
VNLADPEHINVSVRTLRRTKKEDTEKRNRRGGDMEEKQQV